MPAELGTSHVGDGWSVFELRWVIGWGRAVACAVTDPEVEVRTEKPAWAKRVGVACGSVPVPVVLVGGCPGILYGLRVTFSTITSRDQVFRDFKECSLETWTMLISQGKFVDDVWTRMFSRWLYEKMMTIC